MSSDLQLQFVYSFDDFLNANKMKFHQFPFADGFSQ